MGLGEKDLSWRAKVVQWQAFYPGFPEETANGGVSSPDVFPAGRTRYYKSLFFSKAYDK